MFLVPAGRIQVRARLRAGGAEGGLAEALGADGGKVRQNAAGEDYAGRRAGWRAGWPRARESPNGSPAPRLANLGISCATNAMASWWVLGLFWQMTPV